MWRAWVGFNLSHSLGLILLGAVVVIVGRTSASYEYNAGLFLPLAVVVSIVYLVLGWGTGSEGRSSGWACALCCSRPRGSSISRVGSERLLVKVPSSDESPRGVAWPR